jgi:hypothetical protein
MEITALRNESMLVYKIIEPDPSFEITLIDHHYVKTDNVYEKRFPLPIENENRTISNYIKYAEQMFTEEKRGEPMKWRESLTHFASIAKKAGILWWISGRTALALKGIEIEVDDLDFIFREQDLPALKEAFRNYIIEPVVSTENGPRSKWVKYFGTAYSHCRVCFAAEPHLSVDQPEPVHFGPHAFTRLEPVFFGGFQVLIPPLVLHLSTYKRWGFSDVVEKIKPFMKNKAY